jgi:iduronate 2-sulfatase
MMKDVSNRGRGWALTQVVRGGGGGEGGGGGRKKAAAAAGKAGAPEGARRKGAGLEGEEGGGRNMGYTLRTDRWRFTEWGASGRDGRELYDHDTDPKELTNLAAVPAHAQTLQELSRQLAGAVQASFPASGKLPEARDGHWTPVIR